MKNDAFTESRIPTRNEMLLKMSEEKRLEKLQKERAKLLEATLMRPEEMVKLNIYTELHINVDFKGKILVTPQGQIKCQ